MLLNKINNKTRIPTNAMNVLRANKLASAEWFLIATRLFEAIIILGGMGGYY
jgi:hypothetical protein